MDATTREPHGQDYSQIANHLWTARAAAESCRSAPSAARARARKQYESDESACQEAQEGLTNCREPGYQGFTGAERTPCAGEATHVGCRRLPDGRMTDQKKAGKALQAEQRRARLAQQLRANLRKRKQQARGR